MKTFDQVKQSPRPIVPGCNFYDMQTMLVMHCDSRTEKHVFAKDQPFEAADCLHEQDAVDCGFVDGWRTPGNAPDAEDVYWVVYEMRGQVWQSQAEYTAQGWQIFAHVLAWRDLPALPDWIQ